MYYHISSTAHTSGNTSLFGRTILEAIVDRSSGNVTLFKAESTSTIWPGILLAVS